MKIVYQCNADGVFVGETAAQESPLEPGVYLLPAGAHELSPPAIPDGKCAVWMIDGGDWSLQDLPAVDTAPAQTAAELAAQLWSRYQEQAKTAYADSTDVVMRCYESEVTVPVEWVAYRKKLRLIVSAVSGDPAQPLPERPVDPVGI